MKKEGQAFSKLSWAYRSLDRMMKAPPPGKLTFFSAYPGVGKMAFALNLIDRLAIGQKIPIGLFSLSMNKNQLLVHLAAISGKIDLLQLYLGKGSEKAQEHFAEKLSEIARVPLQIYAAPRLSVKDLEIECRRLKERCRIQMIIIDSFQELYLPEMTKASKNTSALILKSINKIAKELKVPVLVLNSLTDSSLANSQTKDWKKMEKEVEFAMALEHHDAFEEQKGKSISSIRAQINIFKKGRKKGAVKLEFIPRFARFEG
jgi:replicative DNA helicase